MATTQEHIWLSGREMLVREIGGRVRTVRAGMAREGSLGAFRAGLIVFLERRLDHLREGLAALRQSTHPVAESKRQSLDRMVSAVAGTLRHVEVDLDVDGLIAGRNSPMARDKHPAEPKPQPEERRPEWREKSPKRSPRTSVPAGEEDADAQADGDAGDGG
jgi:hypothetical protein